MDVAKRKERDIYINAAERDREMLKGRSYMCR